MNAVARSTEASTSKAAHSGGAQTHTLDWLLRNVMSRSMAGRTIAIAVSLLLVLLFQTWQQHGEQERIGLMARRSLDAQIGQRLRGLEALAQSGSMTAPDIGPDAHRDAMSYRHAFNADVVVANARGEMLLNTRVPWGQALPMVPRPLGRSAMQEAWTRLRPTVGDLFVGPVSRTPMLALAAVVMEAGKPTRGVMATLEASLIAQWLDDLVLPAGVGIGITDSTGALIARSGPFRWGERSTWYRVAWLREGRWGLDNAPFQLTVQTNTMSTWTPVLILAGVLLGCLVLSLTLDLYAARRLAGGLKNDLDALRPGHKDQIHHFTSTEAAALAKAWDQEDRLQRQLLDRLDAQERFQWDILRGLPVPVLVSQDGVVIQANEQALQLFGRTAEQLKGQASADCLHPDERPRVMPLLKHVRSTPGAAEQLSTRIVRGDGTIQAIEVSLARVESGTGPLVLSVLRVQADDNGDEGPCGSASGLRAGARLNALT